MFNILMVEDDKNTQKLLSMVLKLEGYNVFCAGDGIEALELMEREHIDLIVLDVMMPRMNGYEFTEHLRSSNNMTPILMVTAKQLPEERCRGFIVGTDDYLVKPFHDEELILRIRALLRRAQIAGEHKLRIGSAVFDYDALSVERDGELQTLPKKEFYLIYKLLSFPNRIFTRIQLMDEIWGMDSETTETTVNVHIARLRKRFEGWNEFEIVAIRGIGYKAVIHQ